jgi:uncharacterized 2Fe-2S/4Fe-4S cluster protein (DUF4445 family)
VISVNQSDIRRLQLGKAAIRAGIQVLLDNKNIKEADIGEVIIAGAFGTFIDIESAIDVGMLPSLPVRRFRQVGNSAGTGARMALLSTRMRKKAFDIAKKAHYIELATVPGFADIFAESTFLGRYKLVYGKREKCL